MACRLIDSVEYMEKKEKIYVIVIDERYDYEKGIHTPIVIKDKEKAKAEFKSIVELAYKEWDNEINNRGWIVEESEDSFYIYSDGEEAISHYGVQLYEVEVE